MSTIKPAPTQLFCKVTDNEQQTKSGLLLPSQSTEKTQLADVINVGSEVKHFHQKERIIYKPYTTVEIKLDGVEYFLVDQDDVLGVVIE